MKVLHYITGISPTIGGIEKFILNYFDVRDKDIEIEILTRYFDDTTIISKMFVERNIKIISLDIPHLSYNNLLSFRRKLNEFFKKHEGEYDVLHTHCIEDPFVVVSAKKGGIQTVVTHVHSYSNKERTMRNFIKRIAIFCNSTLADVCLACSAEVGLATYPKNCIGKFTEIVNGIDAKVFEYDAYKREEYRKLLGVEEGYVVCNIARMELVKNQKFLLEIFKEIANYKSNAVLLLIGDGSLRKNLETQAHILNIEEKVMFLGERSDVNGILQASDVFILPSYNEGLGIAVIEAQAAGLKTYVSKDAVPKRVDCTGLVSFIGLDKSPDEWAKIILLQTKEYFRESQYEKICAGNFDNVSLSKALTRIYKREMDV